MNEQKLILGIVQEGRLNVVWPTPIATPVMVYKDAMYVGHPNTPLDLEEAEGEAVLLHGDLQGDVIYSAGVVEKAAGKMVTILVKQVFQ